VIVGEEEIKSNVFTVKNLASGEQTKVPRADLFQAIRPKSSSR
jgi:histidyl-tRNA synthetase